MQRTKDQCRQGEPDQWIGEPCGELTLAIAAKEQFFGSDLNKQKRQGERQKREPTQIIQIVKGLQDIGLWKKPEQNGKAAKRCADAQAVTQEDGASAKERGEWALVQEFEHEAEGDDDKAEGGENGQHPAGAAAAVNFGG